MLNKKINFNKLDKNLKEFEKSEITEANDYGLHKVISFLANRYQTKQVDFDSFTYTDVMNAYTELLCYPVDEGEEVEEMDEALAIQENPWYKERIIEEVCLNLQNINKIYEYEDDDFI